MAPNPLPTPSQREEMIFTALDALRRDDRSDDRTAAAMAPVLTDRGLRDALLVLAAQGHIGWQDLGQAAWTTYHACRHTHPGAASDSLAVIAAIAYLTGDTAAAAITTTVVLDRDPGHRLGQLLDRAIRQRLSPVLWADSLRSLDVSDCMDFTG